MAPPVTKKTPLRTRIDQRMGDLGLSKTALAKALSAKIGRELNGQSIINWSGRGSIPAEYLLPLANVLKVSPDWLQTGENRYQNMPTSAGQNQITIPIHEMETGANMDKSSIRDNLTVSKAWFREATGLEPLESYRIIVAKGDSMTPTINTGDLILIDVDDTKPTDGLLYVKHGESAEIKRASFAGDMVHLISDNNRYPVKQLPVKSVEIIGRVKYVFNGMRV